MSDNDKDKEILIQSSEDGGLEITLPPQPRASGTLTFSTGGGGVVSLKVAWSSTANTSANTSLVSATMTLYASASGTCASGSHLTINGSKKSYTTSLTYSSSQKTHTLTSHSATVAHNSDGTKSITISGAMVWNGTLWNGSSVTVSTLSGSGTAVLDKIATTTNSLNVWNGSSWVKGPAKVWNGSSWVNAIVKVWNGSSWVNAK